MATVDEATQSRVSSDCCPSRLWLGRLLAAGKQQDEVTPVVTPSVAIDQTTRLTGRQKALHRCKTADRILHPATLADQDDAEQARACSSR